MLIPPPPKYRLAQFSFFQPPPPLENPGSTPDYIIKVKARIINEALQKFATDRKQHFHKPGFFKIQKQHNLDQPMYLMAQIQVHVVEVSYVLHALRDSRNYKHGHELFWQTSLDDNACISIL